MDVREKLVELIGSTEYGNGSLVGKNFQKGFIEKIASNLIAHGVTVQKWIPVTERLPDDTDGEFYDSVAIALKNGKVAIGCYRNADREWWGDCLSGGYRDVTNEITYWMPLPEAPKGE